MTFGDYIHQIKYYSYKIIQQEDKLNKIVEILKESKSNGSQIFIAGNGGSAGTAIHMACDFFKMAGLKAISLDDNVPLMTAIINDEGWSNLYTEQLKTLFNKGDILISISVHGGSGEEKAGKWSENLNNAIAYAKHNGGKTIGFSGFDGGQMKFACDVCVIVEAKSTPIVESLHVVLHHYIAFALQEGDRK